MKIIIAEDDTNLINMISPYLESKGHKVVWTTNGDDLLKKIKEIKFDLIITDIQLPERNGIEVFEKARQMEEYKNTPVLLWSGIEIENGGKVAEEKQSVKFLKKPFGLATLEKTIEDFGITDIIRDFSDPGDFKLRE